VFNIMVWVAGVLAIPLVWWAFRRLPSNAQSPAHVPSRSARKEAASQASRTDPALAPPTQVSQVPESLPAGLDSFHWVQVHELHATRLDALLDLVKRIPRPPSSMQRLLSADFVDKASSSELSDLVMSEPLIAARVIAAVNAPYYGLHKPVTNIGQAVSYMGMSNVRRIFLQYMLAETFKSGAFGSAKVLDVIWLASAVASEISVHLGKALHLPDQAALATRSVLSFVGPLATASLLPGRDLDGWLTVGRLRRTEREQAVLGLSAGEIGGLLMRSWGLPSSLIDDVCGASRLLGMPADTTQPAGAPRLALSYLCNHLGELLATGQLRSLEGYDVMHDTNPNTYYLRDVLNHPTLDLRSYIGHPASVRLNAALQSPELQAPLQLMLNQAPKTP
jgi:HD-like signal output (HDOD) protein